MGSLSGLEVPTHWEAQRQATAGRASGQRALGGHRDPGGLGETSPRGPPASG